MKIAVAITWIPFWLYWLAAATSAKQSTVRRRRLPLTGLSIVAVLVLVRVFRGGSLDVHNLVLGAIGAVVFATGLALAIWARVHLGHNWGMPMTQRIEPDLVTSGPYRFVRNPIYTGLLLGTLGTALVTNLTGLIVVALLAGCFYWSAATEERNLVQAFPDCYPAYRARTKMFVPFVF
ncbi:MAG: methyltransferase family protein [Candidatus Dormibacteraceae bacterium]